MKYIFHYGNIYFQYGIEPVLLNSLLAWLECKYLGLWYVGLYGYSCLGPAGLHESNELSQRQAPEFPAGLAPWWQPCTLYLLSLEEVREEEKETFTHDAYVPESDLGPFSHIVSFMSLNYPATWAYHCPKPNSLPCCCQRVPTHFSSAPTRIPREQGACH